MRGQKKLAALFRGSEMKAFPSGPSKGMSPETAPVVTSAPAAPEPTAIDKLKGQLGRGWDAAKGYGEKAVNFAKENPGTAAGIGAGVGAVGLLAYLLGRRKRPSRPQY